MILAFRQRSYPSVATLLGIFAALALAGRAPAADAPSANGPAANDPARLAPAEALAYAGWSKLNDGEWRMLQWLEAALGSQVATGSLPSAEQRTLRAALEVAALATRHTGAISFLLTPHALQPDVLIVVRAGQDAAALSAAFERAAAAAAPDQPQRAAELGGVQFQARSLDDGQMLRWGVHEQYFLVGSSTRAAGLAAELATGRSRTLAETPGYALGRDRTKARFEPWHVGLHVDLAAVLDRVRAETAGAATPDSDDPLTIGQIFDASGLSAFRALTITGDVVEYGRRMSIFVQVEAVDAPLSNLLRQKPLDDAALRVIPRDVWWATAWRLNLAELWKDVQQAVEKVSPDYRLQLDGFVAMFRQFLGFSLTDDLLPALGDTMILYDAPEHGGVLFTGAVLVTDLADPAAVHGIAQRVVQLVAPLASQAQARLTPKQMSWSGQTIHYLLVGGMPVPLAPAWATVGQRGVFGLFPQTVATVVERVAAPPRVSLLDNPDFKAARALLPPTASALGYVDSRAAHRWWYTLRLLVQTALAALSVGGETELDPAGLPPFPQDLEKVRNTVWSHHVDEHGLLVTALGSAPWQYFFVGDTSLFALFGTSGALLGVLEQGFRRSAALEETSKLRQIGMALAIYAMEHDGRHPQALEELVELGFITADVLHHGDEDARVGFAYVRGLNTDAPPESVLAYRREPVGDVVLYLRLDGAVESVTLAELRERLRATLQRLGREAEMPSW